MKELHGTEWYGEYATLTDEHNDYVQIEYKCNGTGRLYDYTLFPGIDLIFMDFNCSDTFHEPIVALQKKRKNVAVKMKKERRLRSCLNTS